MSALYRRHQALIGAVAGFGVLIAGLVVLVLPGGSTSLAAPPESLSPGLINRTDEVHDLHISSRDDSLILERTIEGWALVSRGGYPADAELAQRLLNGLATLQPVAQRTRLESWLDRLDLGSPETGGNGVRIVARNANERVVADLVIGRQRADGHVYVRQADTQQSWLARGFLPEFSSAANWMELDFLSLGRDSIREACVQPENGEPFCLQRLRLSADQFELVSPREWSLVSPGAGDGVATVLGRIRFQDARPRAEIRGETLAVHRTTTINGLEVSVRVLRTDASGDWVTLQAIAQTDAARPQAIQVNERADGWAFAISDLAASRFTRPLDGIAMRSPEPDTP
ncbi:hypothetical protein [Hyphobacterium sp.]|uniref:hypothetical protein n=1 Tax=Hyphobacterium sp. TaxID=2004662 RepID=UPI003BAB58FE